MCGCAHTRVQLFGELQREKTSYFALGCIILVTIGLRSLHEVKPGGGVELKCLRELLSAFLIRGKWVTSSGLLDPAACLGSAAKTNEDPLRRSVPGASRAGGGSVWLLTAHRHRPGTARGIPFRHLQSLCQAHLFWISQPRSHSLGGCAELSMRTF